MAQPITWRNIEAPDMRGVMQGMGIAQQGMNSGFDKLQNVFKTIEDTDKANWEQQKQNNTQAFMNELTKYRTPEELQAAQASGVLDRIRSAYGAQVDANAIRAAEENRIPLLQQRTKAANEYQDYTTDRTQAEDVDRINSLVAQGKHNEATAELERLQLRKEAPLYEALKNSQRQTTLDDRAKVKFDREGEEHEWKGTKMEDDLRTSAAHRALFGAQAEHYRNVDAQDRTSREAAAVANKAFESRRKELLSQNYWGSGDATSPEGRKAIDDALKGIKDPGEREEVRNSLSEYSSKGIPIRDKTGKVINRIPLSADMFIEAIEGTKDSWYSTALTGSNHGQRAAKWLEKRFSDPESFDPEMRQRYLDGYNLYTRTDPTVETKVSQDVLPKPSSVRTPSIDAKGNTVLPALNGNLQNDPVKRRLLRRPESETPEISAPVATNVGKAPIKVTDSQSFSVASDGSTAPSDPIKIPKGSLSKPVQVESARPGAVPKGQGTKVVATFVTDGDSFYFNGGKTPDYECRLDVVDAPETKKAKYNKPGQPYGAEASAYLKSMIENKEVDIHISGSDSRGRNICQVEINGKDVDLELIKAGMGWLYRNYVTPGSPRYKELDAAEGVAKKNRVGLWKDNSPEYPENFRKRTSN